MVSRLGRGIRFTLQLVRRIVGQPQRWQPPLCRADSDDARLATWFDRAYRDWSTSLTSTGSITRSPTSPLRMVLTSQGWAIGEVRSKSLWDGNGHLARTRPHGGDRAQSLRRLAALPEGRLVRCHFAMLSWWHWSSWGHDWSRRNSCSGSFLRPSSTIAPVQSSRTFSVCVESRARW